jgi:hypothetical protein
MKAKSGFVIEKAVKELFGENVSKEEAIREIERKPENHRLLIPGILDQLKSIIPGYQNEVTVFCLPQHF